MTTMTKHTLTTIILMLGVSPAVTAFAAESPSWLIIDDFDRRDSNYHGHGWESFNPGYWKVQNQSLRHRLTNPGRAFTQWKRGWSRWFPWHWETHSGQPMPMEYDLSLPCGMIWRCDWKLTGNFRTRIEATIRALPPESQSPPKWRRDEKGYALMGICFGGESLYESWCGGGPRQLKKDDPWLTSGSASWMATWRDDARFGIYDHATDQPKTAQDQSEEPSQKLRVADKINIDLTVTGDNPETATVIAKLTAHDKETTVTCTDVNRKKFTDGHFGLVARGLIDFEVNRVLLDPGNNKPIDAPINDLHVCYPLGDTLKKVDGRWQCRFITLFRSDGNRADLRISDSPDPPGGWAAVPVAGSAPIINNDFRINTAVIDATLPVSPADKTLYYAVFKDSKDVTADPRTGWLGKKDYVGRLPRLTAPYRLCGLGGHAIAGPTELPRAAWFQENWIHSQPTPNAYKYLEDYNFQILVHEDDVWYLELVLPPPSVDDAYKTITTTITGPAGRWQMMRHWNILNPGDHDHGIDDAKGPEQIIVRTHDDVGLDPVYVGRNYQIVSHLMCGEENPSPTDNPKRWRRWKMPNRDFSLIILDSRMWRTSQDTNIWDDEGWGHKENIYDRTDPTRALLGEEQFAWLETIIRTDSSPLICLTGINALHTVWSGFFKDEKTGLMFKQRDRVAADYAGWVKAGADRVIDLLSSRDGIITVYGDVHLGCIMRNLEHRLYECCFGAIGRYGARRVKEDFGPTMTDYDGRPVQIHALYHDKYGTPDLQARSGPKNWSMLEMNFDPRGLEPMIGLKLRNLVDPPAEEPRGGGTVSEPAANTGRGHTCKLPTVKTLANADVHFATAEGRPIRGTHSLADGAVPITGLVDIKPNTRIIMTANNGENADAQMLTTLPLP